MRNAFFKNISFIIVPREVLYTITNHKVKL